MKSLIRKIASKILNLEDEKTISYHEGYTKGYADGHLNGYQDGCEDTTKLIFSKKKTTKACLKCSTIFVSYICQDKKYCSKRCGIQSGIIHWNTGRKKKAPVVDTIPPPIVPTAIVPEIPVVAISATTEPDTLKAATPLVIPSIGWTPEQKKARIKALSQW